ncbi:hypothetical protein BpHYR1_032724 [Brachionus plicatilis]|uniref:Uncharacterized protein n=1 Tax=Brachionus plicatilis TaxID=10195 RepID=A0A3M7SJM8_BRAPC|nr:hypothetical protein BpHYR1_032724 [Brachionus plicatilis]
MHKNFKDFQILDIFEFSSSGFFRKYRKFLFFFILPHILYLRKKIQIEKKKISKIPKIFFEDLRQKTVLQNVSADINFVLPKLSLGIIISMNF